jgi:hypothetical protein
LFLFLNHNLLVIINSILTGPEADVLAKLDIQMLAIAVFPLDQIVAKFLADFLAMYPKDTGHIKSKAVAQIHHRILNNTIALRIAFGTDKIVKELSLKSSKTFR